MTDAEWIALIAPVFDASFYAANRTYGLIGPPDDAPPPLEDYLSGAGFDDTPGFNPLSDAEFADAIFADPNSAFDAGGYLFANPDVAAAGVDPLVHYLTFGEAEMLSGARPVGDFGFDPVHYSAVNGDVAAAYEAGTLDSLLHHLIAFGLAEGRDSFDRSGDDAVAGGSRGDVLFGRDGDDVLSGGDGDDLLDGGPGDDRLIGNDGADRLTGGSGADVFAFLVPDDSQAVEGFLQVVSADTILDFEDAVDRIDLSALGVNGDVRVESLALPGPATEALEFDGIQFNGAAVLVLEVIPGVEPEPGVPQTRDYEIYVDADRDGSYDAGRDLLVYVRSEDDVSWSRDDFVFADVDPNAGRIIEGDDLPNRLVGGQGEDVIRGFGGDDALIGSTGQDVLEGGAGDDSLYGGTTGVSGVDLYAIEEIPTVRGLRFTLNGQTITVDIPFEVLILDVLTLAEFLNAELVAVDPLLGASATGDGLVIEDLGGRFFSGVTLLEADGETPVPFTFGGQFTTDVLPDPSPDTLEGGPGADLLFGGGGEDVFIFWRGDSLIDGPDIVEDHQDGEALQVILSSRPLDGAVVELEAASAFVRFDDISPELAQAADPTLFGEDNVIIRTPPTDFVDRVRIFVDIDGDGGFDPAIDTVIDIRGDAPDAADIMLFI